MSCSSDPRATGPRRVCVPAEAVGRAEPGGPAELPGGLGAGKGSACWKSGAPGRLGSAAKAEGGGTGLRGRGSAGYGRVEPASFGEKI